MSVFEAIGNTPLVQLPAGGRHLRDSEIVGETPHRRREEA
jgi:hypothetical protein